MIEGKRFIWFVTIRLVVVSMLFAATTFLFYKDPATFSRTVFVWTLALSALSLVLSAAVLLISRYSTRLIRTAIYLLLIWDLHFATVILLLTGGILSPFSFLYLIIIIGVSISLSRREALLCASLCSILYGALLDFQYYGKLERLGLSQAQATQFGAPYVLYLIFINIFSYFLAALLSGYLAERVRSSERALARKVIDYEELERLNSAIVANLDSGLVTVNNQLKIRVMNRYALDLARTSQEDAYDAELSDMLPIFSAIRFDVVAQQRSEISYLDETGDSRILGYKVVPLLSREGDREGFIISFKDLTEIKRLEERLLHADKLAAIGELSARIAHEIRNPLAAISGSVQLIAQGNNVDSADRKLFAIVLREAERLNGLITDFLSYAKPKRPLLRSVNVANLLNEFAQIARQDDRFQRSNLHVDCPGEICAVIDVELISQALWNLVLNALEARKADGNIWLSAAVALGNNGLQAGIEMQVKDDGAGIAPEQIPHLFEPFYTTKSGGTGLGLATVDRIIAAHRGTIDVCSEQGGTIFRIWLPSLAAAEENENENINTDRR